MEEEENCGEQKQTEEQEAVFPPGFRFHPTDQELVGFYLLRKVQGKSINFDLITHLDIYKHDPWDLPKMVSSRGEHEWYFFCMRVRKYRNSTRPNRVTVTVCGFWKATGIDKPVHASNKSIIGLKKSLVYYQGTAGKGTKTDWMMHEYRFPPTHSTSNQEAEVWTICRVFKRNAPYKKCIKPKWENTINNKTSFWESAGETNSWKDIKSKEETENIPEEIFIVRSPITISSSSSSLWAANDNEFYRNKNWDELGSVVRLGL